MADQDLEVLYKTKKENALTQLKINEI